MAITPKVFQKLTEALAKKVSVGHYEVAFAKSQAEIEASQALRYRVLFKEGKGRVTQEMERLEREVDVWDEYAYHIIVTDQRDGMLVGSLRLVSTQKLPENLKSYTEQYFDLSKIREKYENCLLYTSPSPRDS